MARPAYRYAHQQQRKAALARLVDGQDLCPRCGKPLYTWQDLHYDHLLPVAVGGGAGPKVLSHAACNIRHGARLGRARQLAAQRAKRASQQSSQYNRW